MQARFIWTGMLSLCAAALAAAELQTAGEMLIDLDAARFEGLEVGANVLEWPNAGSEPDFAHLNTHNTEARPTYQIRNGAPAVRFAGSSTGSMTNGVPTPAAITGNQAWSMEAWIAPTRRQTDERYFLSLTSHNGLEDNNYSRATFRLDMKDTIAVDFWGVNLKWGRRAPEDSLYRPMEERWSYICVVHELSGYNRIYVNGHLASELNATLNLSDVQPCFVGISGIAKRDDLNDDGSPKWERQAYADFGQIRVQTGSLSAAQVLANFNAEKARYGVTDTADALWLDGGTWFEDRPFAQDDNLIIEGDQPVVFNNGASNEVHFVTVNAAKNTGLTVDNGTQLVVSYGNNPVMLGNLAGGTFALDIPSGEFATPANSLSIGAYSTAVATVGGREDATGFLNIGSSLRVGDYATGKGELTVKKNGSVYVNSTFRISDNGATENSVTIEEGGTLTVWDNMYISSGTGEGRLDVWGTVVNGATNKYPNCYLAANNETSKGTIWAHPGALLSIQTFRIDGDNEQAQGTLVLEDATLRQTWGGRTWWLAPQCVLEIKDKATFECDENTMTKSVIGARVRDITEDGHATVEKIGPGTMSFTNDGAHAPITDAMTFVVKEGRMTIATADTFAPDNASTFLLDGGTISADWVGGAAWLLARLDRTSKGRFLIHGNNAAENLDFSQHPDVEIVPDGGITMTGNITPFNNKYVFRPIAGLSTYAGDIADKNGQPASVEIYGETDTDGIVLSGVNDAMSGNISVFKGVLGISGGTEAAGGATTKLYLAEGTSLKLDARVGKTFFSTRVDPASRPASILLTSNSAMVDVDLAMFPGCRVSTDAEELVVHQGALLPTAENEILLGGGFLAYWAQPYPGFQPAPIADTPAGPVKVQIATEGIANMSNPANSYSGGTEILNRGVAYVTADGFGAVPETFDEDNIYINGGVLRNANANFELAATRGVKIGPDGGEIHPWNSYSLTLLGGLSGTGPLSITDSGIIVFAGANNTYNGPISATSAEQQIIIGGDEHFSWVSEGGITTPGVVVLKASAEATFNDTVAGAASLKKDGAGTLTLTKSQDYTGPTTVADGQLVLAEGVTLANTSGVENNGEIVLASPEAIGAGDISGDGRFTLLSGASLDLAGSRIVGTPSFDVQAGASLALDGPGFSPNSAISVTEGANLTLGAGFPNEIIGFDGFVLNGTARVTEDGALRLTDNVAGQGASAFFGRMVRVTEPWMATFTYHPGAHSNWADDLLGVALVIQNAEAGTAALSSNGSAVGNGLEKSVAAVMRLGYNGTTYTTYGTSIGGVIDDTGTWNSNALAAHDGNVQKVTLTYDGEHLVCTFDGAGNHRPLDRSKEPAVNLRELFGSDYAWIGFTAATGNATGCEQTITDFTFRSGTAMTPQGCAREDWWYAKYAPTAVELDGEPAIQLTSGEQYVRTAAWHKTRVMLDRPFTATFKYRASEPNENGPGYGFTVAFQNNNDMLYGDGNENYGFLNGTGDKAKSAGYVINIYKSAGEQEFLFHKAGAWVENRGQNQGTALTGWNLVDGEDTQFTLHYDGANLSITAERGIWSVSESHAVDLQGVLAGRLGWIGFCGSSSTKAARQVIHDFKLVYDDETDTSSYASRFTIDGAMQLNLAAGTVGFKNLELADGAAVTPVGTGTRSVLALKGTVVKGNATVRSGENVPVVLDGTIRYPENVGTLKLVGDVRTNGEKVKLELATIKGVHRLLDLSEVDTALTLDDFELTGTAPQPLKMDLQNGILRVWRDVSTAIFFR